MTLPFLPMMILMSTTGIILLSVLVPIALIALVFLIIFLHRHFSHHTYNSYRTSYDESHGILVNSCNNMLNRLQVLGKSSQDYQKQFIDNEKKYIDILNIKDANLARSLNDLDAAVKKKDRKKVKELTPGVVSSLDEFSKTVTDFNADLTSLLSEDTDIHSFSVSSKEKYRRIKEFYSEHKGELAPVSPAFETIFHGAEDSFTQFDKLSNEAKFQEAKTILDKEEKILNSVMNIMDELPTLVVTLYHVIPDKSAELKKEYDQMLSENFYLSDLHVEKLLDEIKKECAKLEEQLSYLSIKDMKRKLESMQSAIRDMKTSFDEERRAKEDFSNYQKTPGVNSYEIEWKYSNLLNKLPKCEKTYLMNPKYVEEIKSLKPDIEILGEMTRDLEAFVGTSSRQPYTAVLKNIKEMGQLKDKICHSMDEYEAYLLSLRKDSQRVYEGIRNDYFVLLDAQNRVHLTNVNKFEEKMTPRFDALYQEIHDIDQFIVQFPVDVGKAVSRYEDLHKKINAISEESKNNWNDSRYAETCIVYANAYRLDHVDARKPLQEAENAFNNADFKSATKDALQVIKLFNPEYTERK